eukprot:5095686-Prymnesium_polylepis.1
MRASRASRLARGQRSAPSAIGRVAGLSNVVRGRGPAVGTCRSVLVVAKPYRSQVRRGCSRRTS